MIPLLYAAGVWTLYCTTVLPVAVLNAVRISAGARLAAARRVVGR